MRGFPQAHVRAATRDRTTVGEVPCHWGLLAALFWNVTRGWEVGFVEANPGESHLFLVPGEPV